MVFTPLPAGTLSSQPQDSDNFWYVHSVLFTQGAYSTILRYTGMYVCLLVVGLVVNISVCCS